MRAIDRCSGARWRDLAPDPGRAPAVPRPRTRRDRSSRARAVVAGKSERGANRAWAESIQHPYGAPASAPDQPVTNGVVLSRIHVRRLDASVTMLTSAYFFTSISFLRKPTS